MSHPSPASNSKTYGREILERINAAYVEFDRDWNFAYVNVWAAEMFGCGTDDLIGRNLWQEFPVLAGTLADQEFHRAAEQAVDSRFTYFCPLLQRWAELHVIPTDSGFSLFLRDMTKHQETEEEVRRLNRDLMGRVNELQTLLNVVPVGIAIATDPECRDIRTNPAAAAMLGISPTDNASKSGPDPGKLPFKVRREGRELTPDELPMQFAAAHNAQLRDVEIEVVRDDGRVVNLFEYASPLLDEQGQVRGCLGVLVDISERKHAETQLQAIYELTSRVAHTSNLEDIFSATLDALEQIFKTKRCSIMLADEQGMMRFKAWRGITDRHRAIVEGSDRGRHGGRPQQILISDAEKADIGILQSMLLSEGIRALGIVPLIVEPTVIGKLVVYFDQPHVFNDVDRNLLHTIAYHAAYGIQRLLAETDRLRLLELERLARAEAERANRLKDEFLAVVSHEIRTPLNAITGWCHLLGSGTLDDQEMARAIDTIIRNAHSQAKLIDDILDVSRIISGKLQLQKNPVLLSAIIQAALDSVGPAAEHKQIEFSTRISSHRATTLGDFERLQQVILNILSNAVKFSPPGTGIEIVFEDDGSEARLTVTDKGHGISPEFLPYVFERFRQADSSTTRKHGGLGLGLSIAKDILELHGGSISVHSDGAGLGTQVTARLPIIMTESIIAGAGVTESVPVRPLNGIRALAVDDHAETLEMLGTLLEGEGAIVRCCGSAAEAILALTDFDPDVLVADIAMPDEDGCSLLMRLRTEHGKTMPAIAVTACVRQEDRERISNAGYDIQISKPLAADALIRALARLCRIAD